MVEEFAAIRVVAVRNMLPGPAVWVVLRRHVETQVLQSYLCNAPVDTALETLVHIRDIRWPIATCCEDSKQLLGMGDDEVRSWTGWHHHMTFVTLAHFFVVRMSLRLKKSPRGDIAPSGVGGGVASPRVCPAVGAGHSDLSPMEKPCGVSLTSAASHWRQWERTRVVVLGLLA